ncbi:MAG: UDP-N-acetylmuramoyl-tripeptide--D-alanyl-D-alanine ligase [Bacteroidia bacterium]
MTTEGLLDLFLRNQSVCTDTRKVKAGDLFFALKGERFNGNLFAAQALKAGADFAIVDEADACIAGDERYILVEDGLWALQDLARAYRRTLSIPFLGITGSNGKTTTKELVYAVLSTSHKTFATQGNFNNHIGVPLTLLSIPKDTEIAIIEMGANQAGDIKELVEIAEPTHGLITNIGQAHLERFGSLDGVQKTKGELFDFLRANGGTLFVNLADERVVKAANYHNNDISFGTAEADFQIELLSQGITGMKLRFVDSKQSPLELETQLSGAYNAMNILVGAMLGSYFGVPRSDIQKGIYGYQAKNNRSEIVKRGNLTILLDAYNANPSSMRAAIQNIFQYSDQRVLLILGDMLEMGEQEAQIHADLGRFINQFDPICTIGVGARMQSMVDVLEGPSSWYLNTQDAVAGVLETSKSADMILIKGSRGIALEKLLAHFPETLRT